MAEKTIFVVDDDEAFRTSLAVLLKSAGYAAETYASGPAFLDVCQEAAGACVLLDVRMPVMSGLEVQETLKLRRPDLPVIMITGHGDVPMAVRALKSGAVDFIEKPFRDDNLLAGIARAIALPWTVAAGINVELKAKIDSLSPREREVLELLVVGRPNKIIAYELGISPRTTEIHRARVMEKMGAESLSHLVRMALAAGIDPEPL
jgi:two-component system response regulator FixJ